MVLDPLFDKPDTVGRDVAELAPAIIAADVLGLGWPGPECGYRDFGEDSNTMLTPELKQWETEGQYLRTVLFQNKVFCKQVGDPAAAPEKTLLLLHGFPESSYSFHKVVAGMAKVFQRIVLFDFLGHGLSDKPVENYTYSLFEQADLALQVWKQLGVRGGHLLSHDMGASVATELVARHVSATLPAWFSAGFATFTFTNGSMVLDLADLRVTQKLLLSGIGPLVSKLFGYRAFSQQVRSAHGSDRLSDKDIELLWNNIQQQDGHRKNHLIIKYLNDRKRFEKTRWLPSLSLVKEPIHLCWGDADAVARVEMAHYLKQNVCPGARLTLMPGVGHFCQLSDPDLWVKSVAAFYGLESPLT
jgi:pimeloyl-ACP methyl ester carboxylesterase